MTTELNGLYLIDWMLHIWRAASVCLRMLMCLSVLPSALCVCISCRAVCHEVIVSCRGSSMVKVMQVGSCQMAVHPSLGQGALVPPVRACGAGRSGRGDDDGCHAVLAPPLAAGPAVPGRQLPSLISLLLPWHALWHVSAPARDTWAYLQTATQMIWSKTKASTF